ncbi:MAG: hypothetical protein KAU29_06025 [Gammaproteobacteria bacterium]|nr:hypothetical protein [Gammaproteobacteria bacterium]
MRQFVKASLATVVLGAALVFAGTATAGIINTKHYLGAGGTGSVNSVDAADNGEICIFCHTPHGGDTGTAVPLWNKVLSTATYDTYDTLGTSTLDAGITTIGSVTLACLTCHDGTQALDNIINDSGSGGYLASGGGAGGLAYTWTSGDNSLDATGTFQNSVDDGGNNIFEIGTDLRNDHPVSVQYGGGGVSSTATAGPTRDSDFTVPDYNGVGGNTWWIDNTTMEGSGSTAGELDKWDFKLYTRTDNSGGLFAGTPEPFVECGSCHDPHLETDTFLRISTAANSGASNFGSAVCLTCHTK